MKMKKIEEIEMEYIGNKPNFREDLEQDTLTTDFVAINEFEIMTSDFEHIGKDFSTLRGPIMRSGKFLYNKCGEEVAVYKDWDNIKEVINETKFIPVKATIEKGAHASPIQGYCTNFDLNSETEQVFADVVLFENLEDITPLIGDDINYEVSIGFKDSIDENAIQRIIYLDHLAISLQNKELGRCRTAGGKACNIKVKNN